MIEGKLEKRKKSLLSAPIGKKVIFFIDDLNMPKLDRYGAQPALELLRLVSSSTNTCKRLNVSNF
jgi:dynein heavy chain